jgi:electron transfer flavoprotein beta subunit
VHNLEVTDDKVVAERILENGCEHIESPFPVLITVLGSLNEPRFPTVGGMLDATSPRAPVEVWNAADIDAKAPDVGLLGSLTHVTKTFTPKGARETKRLEGSPGSIAEQLIEAFRQRDIHLGD